MSFILARAGQFVDQVGVAPLIVIGIVAVFVLWWLLRP